MSQQTSRQEATPERALESPSTTDLLSLVVSPKIETSPELLLNSQLPPSEQQLMDELKALLEQRSTELETGGLSEFKTFTLSEVSQSITPCIRYLLLQQVIKIVNGVLFNQDPPHFIPGTPLTVRSVDDAVFDGWLAPGVEKRAQWTGAGKHITSKKGKWYQGLVTSRMALEVLPSQGSVMNVASNEVVNRIVSLVERSETAQAVVENISTLALGIHWLTLETTAER
ncbi:hypothetical protein SISSUDRAFT_1038402, partial [Sistotremastrum suecicum HHB10207 ss-3]